MPQTWSRHIGEWYHDYQPDNDFGLGGGSVIPLFHNTYPYLSIAATYPFDHIVIDLFGPLPSDEHGFSYVMFICDFGFPKIIQSDNGTEFANALDLTIVSSLCIIPELTVLLRKGINDCYTSHYHSSPFELFFSRPSNLPDNFSSSTSSLLSLEECQKQIIDLHSLVWPSAVSTTEEYNNKIADLFNKKAPLVSFAPGDTVMLVNSGANPKTDPKYLVSSPLERLESLEVTPGNLQVTSTTSTLLTIIGNICIRKVKLPLHGGGSDVDLSPAFPGTFLSLELKNKETKKSLPNPSKASFLPWLPSQL
ncbi:Reverse transcriptase domain-containing protein [Balamuthia mandrillaris]